MKKVILFLVAIMSLTISLKAQDLITKKNGEDIKATVLEVLQEEVKYKLYDEPNGPTYTVTKSELLMIRYKSGRNEIFNQQPSSSLSIHMTLSELRKYYDPGCYIPSIYDRYSPFWVGVASFIIPGLGETFVGEFGKGVGRFLGVIALKSAGLVFVASSPSLGVSLLLSSFFLGLYSICDAANIAKIKNMYAQDLRRDYSLDMKLYPSVNYACVGNSIVPTAGITFALNF